VPILHSRSRKFKLPYFIGAVLICVGLFANEGVMKRLFSSDGFLEFETRIQIWFFDAVLVLSGLFVLWYARRTAGEGALRHSIRNYPKTTASVFAFVLAAIFWFSTEVLFYFLNHFWTGDRVAYEHHIEEAFSRVATLGEGYQKDALVGYKPSPNMRKTSKMTFNGRPIYNVTYSTDELGRRITPIKTVGKPDKFILFFGCSYTFGDGVEDDETLPFFVGQLASRSRPYNYGVSGFGPQQMVAKLQQGNIKAEIDEPEGFLVYTFIDDHVHRVIGSQHIVQTWGRYMPYYGLDSGGNLERRGDFEGGRPVSTLLFSLLRKSEIAQYFRVGVPQRINDDDFALTAKIFLESRNAFSRLFKRENFFVLIYPGSVWRKKLIPHLEKAGVQYFDYFNLFDPNQTDLHIERDRHPTPKAYRIVAERLTLDLRIQEARKE